MATQHERRADTRRALLEAAARLFVERGISDAPVDEIASAAGRTAGAIYHHFGSKDGLVFALVDEWLGDVNASTLAALTAASTRDERLAALWRGTTNAQAGKGQWLQLEHELWAYAARNEPARDRLAERYREIWAGIEALADVWPDLRELRGRGPVVLGLLTGLEMMRRVDPAAVSDEMAIATLRGAITDGQEPTP
jgi:AcrR family transcriptional regulator